MIARQFPHNIYLFQDYNAPVHRAALTRQYCTRNRLKCMSWPSKSPDLNIIENVWLYIKRKLHANVLHIKTQRTFHRNSADEPGYIQSLYKSIPRRIQNVIRLKEHLTKYLGKNVLNSHYLISVIPLQKGDKNAGFPIWPPL